VPPRVSPPCVEQNGGPTLYNAVSFEQKGNLRRYHGRRP
jgi:hypothetical protein